MSGTATGPPWKHATATCAHVAATEISHTTFGVTPEFLCVWFSTRKVKPAIGLDGLWRVQQRGTGAGTEGVHFGTFWFHFGVILFFVDAPLWGNFGFTLGTFWVTLSALWNHF